jgi:hypothetical protein
MGESDADKKIILKPRELFSDAILPQNADELARFMDQPLMAIAEAITGALATGPKAWTLMTGHIVQGMLKGKLWQQVSREIKELRDKGKIPGDFADAEKYKYGFKSWVELLTIIDEEAPDTDRLEALKAMFYAVNRIDVDDGQRIVAYQLFQISKRLTSGELLLLREVFVAYGTGLYASPERVVMTGWASDMAGRLGHGLSSLVIRDQNALVEEGLLTPRIDVSPGQYQPNQIWVSKLNARITDLGIRFCENLKTYEVVKEELLV